MLKPTASLVSSLSRAMTRLRCVLLVVVLTHITFSNIVVVNICMHVNIGDPHLPINITLRGKASICTQFMIDKGGVATGDHDFHCVNFTPNVS